MFAKFSHLNFINKSAILVSLIFTSEKAWIFTFMIYKPLVCFQGSYRNVRKYLPMKNLLLALNYLHQLLQFFVQQILPHVQSPGWGFDYFYENIFLQYVNICIKETPLFCIFCMNSRFWDFPPYSKVSCLCAFSFLKLKSSFKIEFKKSFRNDFYFLSFSVKRISIHDTD